MTKEAISTERALKLALEALEYIEHNYMSLPASAEKAITALREALTSVPDWASEAKEQPAQTDWEAVAADQALTIGLLKAVQPAQRKPLTYEQRQYIIRMWKVGNWNVGDCIDEVEATHGIKENT